MFVIRNTLLNACTGSLPSKPVPSAFSLGGLSRIGLPVKPGSHLKRTITALDDEETEDRKFQKLDLPDVNPEVQTGEGGNEDAIGDDLAAADVEESEVEDVKPAIPDATMEVDKKEEEEEIDPLDAYMAQTEMQAAAVDAEDARKAGLFGGGDDSDDEPDVENKQEAEILSKEALLQ
jgi:ATP-dependent RNA helicase DDX46/PRP5